MFYESIFQENYDDKLDDAREDKECEEWPDDVQELDAFGRFMEFFLITLPKRYTELR